MRALPNNDPLKIGYVDIFILPPDMEELRRRLEGRGTDSQEVIEKRLANAEGEIARAKGKLSNQGFLSKAPAQLVEQEREKLKTNESMLESLAARIAELKQA